MILSYRLVFAGYAAKFHEYCGMPMVSGSECGLENFSGFVVSGLSERGREGGWLCALGFF